MILGILYLLALLAGDALAVIVAPAAAVLLFLGWRGRRIALSMITAGTAGAGVGAGVFWLLTVLLKAEVTNELLVMWAGAGFGFAGLAGAALAGGIEMAVAIIKRAPRPA
ncbi:MAG: hypothetical protein QOC81_2224 [Thermoanaerobaculia bacterium]|nr:hypothetical protein [Thermoanaerobaculia bacterium]